ncbi:hypothetical protein J8657_06515 [Dickeya oryzae]|uniref:Uncharacterized protein n=1 Tax=Dickeya oryzae TaxID=1240404 RepID=A0AB39IVW1_9GAMM|nr:hypothetical protein [Dickeya oryzae]MBP2857251.1 hypothetical protein [Dickeya oryzae]MCA6989286.1 hypothetical protein [Dickeya oryzae]
MSDYDVLFQLRIEHEFFTGCTSLPFYGEWLPGSQQAATSIGLLTKPQADGVLVLADRTHPALQAVEHVTLRWWFSSREPNFFSYTDTSVTDASGLLEPKTPHFRYTLNGAEPGEVRLETSSDRLTEASHRLRPSTKGWLWLVDIEINATAITAFLNRRTEPVFIMPFRCQRRRWKYLFTAPYVNTNTCIRDNCQNNQFDYLGEEILANGQRAQAFISCEPLRIQKKSDYYFQLYQDNTVLIERLPVAMPQHQCRFQTDKSFDVVSEIIVN